MNHNDNRLIQTVCNETNYKLQQLTGEPYNKDTVNIIEQTLQNTIDKLRDKNVVEQNKPVSKAQTMWESFTFKQKVINTICNKLIPVISRNERTIINKQNSANIKKLGECYIKIEYPYWAVKDPKGIILVELEITPTIPLDFINIKVVIDDM